MSMPHADIFGPSKVFVTYFPMIDNSSNWSFVYIWLLFLVLGVQSATCCTRRDVGQLWKFDEHGNVCQVFVSGSIPNTMTESDEMQQSKKCIKELEVFNYVLTQQSYKFFKKSFWSCWCDQEVSSFYVTGTSASQGWWLIDHIACWLLHEVFNFLAHCSCISEEHLILKIRVCTCLNWKLQ